MSTHHSHVVRQPDYFSVTHMSHSEEYEHFSTESPCSSPAFSPTEATSFSQHPLLATRRESICYTMPAASSLLQIQTNASHGRTQSRPQLQNVLHVTSDESTGSSSSKSSMDSSFSSSSDFARCSRCHRTSSIDYKTGQNSMVQWGMNSYYCSRCADVVGMKR
ncbi:uncharacterized protein RCC_12333 [Ramularia collo-cygni]|uniref:Uncharacterized protein n=1 Tax=Ramularia collo-cygni TaxID=112498 RepID=A0A2D3UZC8_9PEZI|nr:uncharacterized protein RCC_12333 [Ramularia collo-cygni]CZT15544.1 uncharacterized protein RCC_12333 [Ramularia collo-cygni]